MVHHTYYVLGKKEDENLFLTEDKTYTIQLSLAEEFLSKEAAQDAIYYYQQAESYEYYTGDFYVGNEVVIRRVEINITDQTN